MRGAVDGVDGVGDVEPFAELEVVGADGQESVEELGGLEEGGHVQGWGGAVVVRGGAEGGEGVVEFGVEDGPEGGEVHGGDFEDEGPEEHVEFGAGEGGGRGGGGGVEELG